MSQRPQPGGLSRFWDATAVIDRSSHPIGLAEPSMSFSVVDQSGGAIQRRTRDPTSNRDDKEAKFNDYEALLLHNDDQNTSHTLLHSLALS
ncbi:MAG: hypothetical protein M1820_003911 [Bogoriella megaspora]|nr:MAG: hypothetical protein M1820_003911 [Bogoriella megaspora]